MSTLAKAMWGVIQACACQSFMGKDGFHFSRPKSHLFKGNRNKDQLNSTLARRALTSMAPQPLAKLSSELFWVTAPGPAPWAGWVNLHGLTPGSVSKTGSDLKRSLGWQSFLKSLFSSCNSVAHLYHKSIVSSLSYDSGQASLNASPWVRSSVSGPLLYPAALPVVNCTLPRGRVWFKSFCSLSF